MNEYTVFYNSECIYAHCGYDHKSLDELYKMIEKGTCIIKGGKLASELNRLYKKAKMDVVFLRHRDYHVFKKEYNKYLGVV